MDQHLAQFYVSDVLIALQPDGHALMTAGRLVNPGAKQTIPQTEQTTKVAVAFLRIN